MVYWTNLPEPEPLYHLYADCPKGSKIEPEQRRSGDEPPAGRKLCDACARRVQYAR